MSSYFGKERRPWKKLYWTEPVNMPYWLYLLTGPGLIVLIFGLAWLIKGG